MAEILLVNPRKRGTPRKKKRRKNTVATKRRTAAQKRATRNLVRLNKERARKRKPRRKNPVTTRRRRKTTTRRKTAARRAPVRRRRRSNPGPRFTGRAIQKQLFEGATGAVGALGLDIVQGYLPLPPQWKTGLVGTGVKALLAIGMGVVAANVRIVRPQTATALANGALTVVLHGELKKQVANFAPGIQMGEYLDPGMGYYGSGYPAGYMDENGMNAYVENDGMGTYLTELTDDGMNIDNYGLGEYEYMEDLSYG